MTENTATANRSGAMTKFENSVRSARETSLPSRRSGSRYSESVRSGTDTAGVPPFRSGLAMGSCS